MPKYMLMFVGTTTTGTTRSRRTSSRRPTPDHDTWWDDLSKTGVIKGGEELEPQRTATTVRRVNGAMKVTDGPFIESKESVGGFALIEVDDLDKAIAIAKSWPGGDVEVRPIVDHSALSIGRSLTSDAVAAVFHEEAGRLTAALVKRLGDFDLAEECVQDALVAALEHWPRYGHPREPRRLAHDDRAPQRDRPAATRDALPREGRAAGGDHR